MNLQAIKQAAEDARYDYRVTDKWLAHSDNCDPETILKLIAVVEASKAFKAEPLYFTPENVKAHADWLDALKALDHE